jgi:vancomycin permeability regulator SanA
VSVFVIMGAAVWADGRASDAMQRRVRSALTNSQNSLDALYLVSGGVGKHPPSEAAVMASLLREAGIEEGRILMEEKSNDTLSSVRNCLRILRSLPDFQEVVICSDTYHIPRCRWLFRLYGISTRGAQVESGRRGNGIVKWAYYCLREAAAIPWDTLLVAIGGKP